MRLFDLRADQQVACYAVDPPSPEAPPMGVSSVAFSGSGRLLFGGYYDNVVRVWDTLRCECVGVLAGHEQRVASIGESIVSNEHLLSSLQPLCLLAPSLATS
jgi:guanine nucleotide-binding protein G(I)/G(S)/G(T) subunit beta-1